MRSQHEVGNRVATEKEEGAGEMADALDRMENAVLRLQWHNAIITRQLLDGADNSSKESLQISASEVFYHPVSKSRNC